MIAIPVHEMGLGSTTNFRSEKIIYEFKEKYKLWSISIVSSNQDSTINYKNILEFHEDFKYLVKDFSSFQYFTITLKLPTYSTSFYMQQFPGLCGICIITNYSDLSGEALDLINDFLYYMGYTVLMISSISGSKYVEHFTNKGFKPYMSLKNRRTHNNVTLFYKRLINT